MILSTAVAAKLVIHLLHDMRVAVPVLDPRHRGTSVCSVGKLIFCGGRRTKSLLSGVQI